MNSAGYCHCYFWYVSHWNHSGEKSPCHSAPKSINHRYLQFYIKHRNGTSLEHKYYRAFKRNKHKILEQESYSGSEQSIKKLGLSDLTHCKIYNVRSLKQIELKSRLASITTSQPHGSAFWLLNLCKYLQTSNQTESTRGDRHKPNN
jgi:hypothetical protein